MRTESCRVNIARFLSWLPRDIRPRRGPAPPRGATAPAALESPAGRTAVTYRPWRRGDSIASAAAAASVEPQTALPAAAEAREGDGMGPPSPARGAAPPAAPCPGG